MKISKCDNYDYSEPLTSTALTSTDPVIELFKKRFKITSAHDGHDGMVHMYNKAYHYVAHLVADTVIFVGKYPNVSIKQPWCKSTYHKYRITK